jgi:Zn-dependent protease
MFLQEPSQTQFDWRFRLFGIPVRVHPLFWLVGVILGFSALQENPGPTGFLYLGMWLACVFVSVLVHEFGHVLSGQMFGSDGHIVLYSFGGLAIGSSDVGTSWQRIFVMFAGPLAGFVLLVVVLIAGCAYDAGFTLWLLGKTLNRHANWGDFDEVPPMWLFHLLFDLISINLYWGLVNLLPIWPLDGGQISRELFQKYARSNAVRSSLILSIITAVLFAFNALMGVIRKEPFIPYLPQGDWFQVIFFAVFAIMSWQLLQQTSVGGGRAYRTEDERYERAPWERDADWWKRG